MGSAAGQTSKEPAPRRAKLALRGELDRRRRSP
jgi:hypothetical protein